MERKGKREKERETDRQAKTGRVLTETWEKNIKNVDSQKPFFKQEGIIRTVECCPNVKQTRNVKYSWHSR